jgi:hypothetical protein
LLSLSLLHARQRLVGGIGVGGTLVVGVVDGDFVVADLLLMCDWGGGRQVGPGGRGLEKVRVAVVGSSFIGMEGAAFLVKAAQVASVTVIGMEQVSPGATSLLMPCACLFIGPLKRY